MKSIFTLTILILNFYIIGKSHTKTNFVLTIRTFNHAEKISNGIMVYEIHDNNLTIKNEDLLKNERILFTKKLKSKNIEQIQNIKIDTLKEFYNNKCVLATSGTQFYISSTIGENQKEIFLHHYYNKQIEALIKKLNSQIPNNFRIKYLSHKTKQDCK